MSALTVTPVLPVGILPVGRGSAATQARQPNLAPLAGISLRQTRFKIMKFLHRISTPSEASCANLWVSARFWAHALRLLTCGADALSLEQMVQGAWMGQGIWTRRALGLGGIAALAATALRAEPAPGFRFAAIDGGELNSLAWRGKPVLVVNTASMCGFARQFDALQDLQDRYADRGLVVLAVPSDDFRQELATEAEVKTYCALNFDLTLAMTVITRVLGPEAHPFYRWMATAHGFVPGWNFNKVLLGRDGVPRGTWGAPVDPLSGRITSAVEVALAA